MARGSGARTVAASARRSESAEEELEATTTGAEHIGSDTSCSCGRNGLQHTFHPNKGPFVNQDLAAQSVLFPELAEKPIVVKLDEEHNSSDGGAVLLKGIVRWG